MDYASEIDLLKVFRYSSPMHGTISFSLRHEAVYLMGVDVCEAQRNED